MSGSAGGERGTATVELRGVRKVFGQTEAVAGIDLTVHTGEFVSLLDPSGSGKTTVLRSALLAGGLLAFALSCDEIIVTTFTAGAEQTLPIWIFNNLFRPNQAPVVNVVAAALIVASILPIWLTQRLSDGTSGGGRL